MTQQPESGQAISPAKPAFTRNPDLYANIPEELKVLPQWILWKYELKNGNWSKVPYSPVTGYRASVNKPNEWSWFAVVEGKIRESMVYDGIGFVFTAHDPYVGIDLDNKENNPTTAQEIAYLSTLFASYRERSPSGLGFHIILKGTIPAPCKKGAVEIYSERRYFTMTGDAV